MQVGYNETVLSERGRQMSMGGQWQPNQCMQLAILPPLSLDIDAEGEPLGVGSTSSTFILVWCGGAQVVLVSAINRQQASS